MTPRNWRQLKRHPISAEYADITGKAFESFVDNVKEHGVLNKRKVTLYEGMVLDGWQLLRACIEANVKPQFQNKPPRITPEEFVSTVNDHRRHETQDIAHKRAEERRARVIAARSSGESLRDIAEAENISVAQVQRDLDSKDEIHCERCARVGPSRNCKTCAELRSKAMTVRTTTKRGAKIVKYDWEKYDRSYTIVAQLTDKLPKIYPACKDEPLLKKVDGLLREAAKNIALIRKKVGR